MAENIILTQKGKIEKEERLRHLIDVELPKADEELNFARSQGDLSENADYDAANTKRGKYWSYTSYTIALYSSSSTYQFQNITSKALSTGRGLLKGVVNINGVNISIYNTHLALGDYTAVNINEIVEELKKDNNPIIIMGDFNVSPNNPSAENNLKTKLENLGFTLAAKDTTKNNMWKKPALCDSIWVKSNGHINVKSQNTIQKYNVLSDHNMVITELEIVK